jgi:hypothetical protein
MYSTLVQLGSEFKVEFGTATGGTVSGTFTTYDFSFEMDRLGGFDVTVKGLARGEGPGRLYDEVDVLNHEYTSGLSFISNFDGVNQKTVTKTFFDAIHYYSQKQTGQLTWPMDTMYDPGDGQAFGYSWRIDLPFCPALDDGQDEAIVVQMPNLSKETPGLIHPGNAKKIHMASTFLRMDALIKLINRYCVTQKGTAKTPFKLSASEKYCKIDWDWGMISSDPTAVCWKFKTNQGSYGKPNTESQMSTQHMDFPTSAMKIHVNMIFIQNIIAMTHQAVDEDSTVESEDRESGKLPMKKFFDQLFGAIRQNTGNWVDLTLDSPPEDPNTIYVVNKNAEPNKTSAPAGLDISLPGSSGGATPGVRDLQITGAIPSSLTAKYFGNAPDQDGTANAAKKVGTNIDSEGNKSTPTASDFNEALANLGIAGYDEGQQSGLRKMVNQRAVNKAKKSAKLDPPPIPLEVTLVTNGCKNWKFGGILKINGLPGKLSGGAELAWTVTEWTQICDGVDWKTEVKCVPRILK